MSVRYWRYLIQAFLGLLFLWQAQFRVSDTGVNMLISVLHQFLIVLNTIFVSESFERFALSFPTSIYLAKKMCNSNTEHFKRYVSCPTCHCLYHYDDAFRIAVDGEHVTRKCSFVSFPNHPHLNKRMPCGTSLMKNVTSMNGKKNFLYPYKVYCQRPISESIEDLLQRPGFTDMLFQRKQRARNELLTDIIDGKVWNTLLDCNGELFCKDKRNLGLILNVDWFQPHKYREHSLGVIYFSIINLPRNLRYKLKNCLIVGIIPGPKEPGLDINSYLRPVVEELKELWEGKLMEENGSTALYRVALVCLSSDIPATRKCGGFMSFCAFKGKSSVIAF